jgi:hypothetical protein
MRFGGHETFSVREGWMHKGLTLLVEEPEKLIDEFAADWLGVGRNMAKSINHWLVATGLAELTAGTKTKRTPLAPTEVGRLIYDKDPFFSEIGTWWVLHIHLTRNPEQAFSWNWFFNRFNQSRFDRSLCVENLKRYLQISNQSKIPSPKTIDRDVACLLSSYSKKVPADQGDPEESNESPFVDLGLLTYFRDTGTYQLNQGAKDVPTEIFGYALASEFGVVGKGPKDVDVSIKNATTQNGSPGRVFSLTADALFEMALSMEGIACDSNLSIVGLAGERHIRFANKTPVQWLKQYYSLEESSSADFLAKVKALGAPL